MKTFIVATAILLSLSLYSCDETSKQSSKSADTMVMKKDTAIKRTDTAGFNK
ncbi:MAG: hypothetical protein SGI89_01205 [bacterium]|nr:hypothetical protein [bacterium]